MTKELTEYDDPYEKTKIKNCDVCGSRVLIDDYGCGECKNCGWEQDGSNLEEYGVGYPNLVSLSKAKELYKKQQNFLPSFKDFIMNLKFYGEMEFYYCRMKYIVIRYTDNDEVEFYKEIDNKNKQIYKTIDEFEQQATIEGKLLRDIWNEIKFVDWLSWVKLQ